MQPTSVADKASLSDLRRNIRADLAAAGVDPSITFDCLIAVTEACAAALSGCSEGSPPPDISWDVDPRWICFRVEQTCERTRSKAWHPSRAAAAADVADETLPIVLIQGLMDAVRVDDAPSGRIVTLTKLLL